MSSYNDGLSSQLISLFIYIYIFTEGLLFMGEITQMETISYEAKIYALVLEDKAGGAIFFMKELK